MQANNDIHRMKLYSYLVKFEHLIRIYIFNKLPQSLDEYLKPIYTFTMYSFEFY